MGRTQLRPAAIGGGFLIVWNWNAAGWVWSEPLACPPQPPPSFLGPHSHIHHTKSPKLGNTAERTADPDTKREEQKIGREPPTPHPGRQGGVEGEEGRWRVLGNGPSMTQR